MLLYYVCIYVYDLFMSCIYVLYLHHTILCIYLGVCSNLCVYIFEDQPTVHSGQCGWLPDFKHVYAYETNPSSEY